MEYQANKIKSLFESDEPVLRLSSGDLSKVVKRLNSIFTAGKKKDSGWQNVSWGNAMKKEQV